jgi:sulfate adenylyltransferase subunit 2
MDQQTFESCVIKLLRTSSQALVWRASNLQEAIEALGTPLNKRTLERRIAETTWLAGGSISSSLLDEFGRPGLITVIDAVTLQARKKRKAVLSLKMHPLPIDEHPASRLAAHVVVAEDGKGAKRWCYLESNDPKALHNALKTLSAGKPSIFFPAGPVVSICRQLNSDLSENLRDPSIEIMTAQFPEMIPVSGDAETQSKKRNNSMAQPEKLSHLDRLEAESLHIIREVMAHAENPVMLYSVGKDSSVMLHLARKAFYPSPPPFPLMHVDTRWKFRAMYDFRDKMAAESNMELLVHINPEGIEKNINPFDHGSALHTDVMKTQGLKQALDLHQFDVAFGGARRDEEKSRAKERIFSFRSSSHRWDPKNQRPELWNLYNCRKAPGESVRVFPLSNWTELDIWQYIYRENIPIVPLYFAAERPVLERNGALIMIDDDRIQPLPGEQIQIKQVRFRTLGCYPLTGAVESSATDLSQIVLELLQSRTSERQGRAIDSDGGASMEKKKQEGYF